MKDFAIHGDTSFLEYAKSATDVITAKDCNFFPGQFPDFKNAQSINLFKDIYNIQFFSNIIAFHLRKDAPNEVNLVWNKESADMPTDFRYSGKNNALVNWPDPKAKQIIKIMGGK